MIPRSIRTTALLAVLATFGPASDLRAAELATAPLGLPRLAATDARRPGTPPALARDAYGVDDLAPLPGARDQRTRTHEQIRSLDLDAGAIWSRPLRSAGNRTVFVSFLLYASCGTEIRIGDVQLRVDAGPTDGGAQLAMAERTPRGFSWRPLGVHAELDSFDGRTLAGLHVITVRIDPKEQTWDLHLGARLAHVGLPLLLSPAGAGRTDVAIRAGADGARLLGLVQSHDHPLVEDANDNGIDDAFERTRNGGRLGRADLAPDARRELAETWMRADTAPRALVVRRPLPDRS
jgi:hypothetical protein